VNDTLEHLQYISHLVLEAECKTADKDDILEAVNSAMDTLAVERAIFIQSAAERGLAEVRLSVQDPPDVEVKVEG